MATLRSLSTSTMPARRVSFDVPLPRVPSVVPLEPTFGVPGHGRLDYLWVTPAQEIVPVPPGYTGDSLPVAVAAVAASRTLFAALAAIATFGAGLAYSTYFQVIGEAEPLALEMMAWAWTAFIICALLAIMWQFVLALNFDPLTPGRAFRHEFTMFCVLVLCIACLIAGVVLLNLALLPNAPSRVVSSAGYVVVGVIGLLTLGSVLRFSHTVVRRTRIQLQARRRVPGSVPVMTDRDKPQPGQWPPTPFSQWDPDIGTRPPSQRRVTIEEPTTSRIGSYDISPGFAGFSPPGTLDADTRLTASPEPVVLDEVNASSRVEDPSKALLSDDVALRAFTLAYSRLAYPLLAVRRRYPQFDGLQRAHRVVLLAQTFKDMHRLSPIWYPVTGPNNTFDVDANGNAAVEQFLLRLPQWERIMNAVWFDGFHQLPPNEIARYLLGAMHGVVPDPSLSQPSRSHSV